MTGTRTDKWYKNGKLKSHFHGKLRGYPGIANTAKQISNYFPETIEVYVEPFAGLGRTAKYANWLKFQVLNDKSEYALQYLKKNFREATITNKDYKDCINEWDSQETFFLVDPPWSEGMYNKDFDDNTDLKGIKIKPFVDRSAQQYYNELMKILPTLKGDWILCSNHNRNTLKKWADSMKYSWLVVESTKRIMGHHIKTLILSNKPLISKGLTLEVFQ